MVGQSSNSNAHGSESKKYWSRSTGKYLFYALGEIALVVIGILIALQINNWNEERKTRDTEIRTLLEIKEDVQSTLVDIEFDSALHEISLDASKEIMKFVSSDQEWHDSISMLFELAYYDFRISSIETAYRSLEAKGVDLISNQELRNMISHLYDYQIPWLRRVEVGNGKFQDLLLPYYQEHFRINLNRSISSGRDIDGNKMLRSEVPRGFIPRDVRKLKNDPKFKVLLREAIYARIEIYDAYLQARRAAYDVIQGIDEEVNNHFRN
jgi:hypothetical protein